MFRNIGGKIKVFVIVAAVLGIISCICFGGTVIAYSLLGDKMLSFLADTGLDKAVKDMTGGASGALGVVTGLIIMTAGSLLVYIAAFIPYGLGQLIQNTDRMVKSLDSLKTTAANLQVNREDTHGGVYPYPVYTDEYGRPYYHVPEDIYYTEENVEDGDLVPDDVAPSAEAQPEDITKQDSPKETVDIPEENTEKVPEKSANELMDELIRKHDEGKNKGRHKKRDKKINPNDNAENKDKDTEKPE